MQIQEFLLSFGTPLIKLVPEKWRWKIWSVNRWLCYSLEALLEINKKEPFSVNFTPNGNFGNYVEEGEKISWLLTDKFIPLKPVYNALYVDIDLSHTVYNDPKELFELTKETFKELWMEPSFIVVKNWWPHIYWIIDPQQRELIDKNISEKEFANISKYLWWLFVWWDLWLWQVNRVMRLPNTRHRKKSNELDWKNPVMTQVFQWYDNDIHLELDEKKMNFIGMSEISWLIERSKDIKLIEESHKQVIKRLSKVIEVETQSISFETVFEKLKKYPRIVKMSMFWSKKWDYIHLDWKQYYFALEWKNIGIQIVNWELIRTHRYKLKTWWDHEFVNNFMEMWTWEDYSIYDRPRWSIYSFLFNYFARDKWRMMKFLEKEFNIDLSTIKTEDLMEWDKLFIAGDSKLLFTKSWVNIETIKTTANWGTAIMNKNIFDVTLLPLWYAETNLNEDYLETKEINKIYVFQDVQNNRNIILKRYNTKANFNKYVNRMWLYCYWDDDSMWLFFSILDKQNLPKLDLISLNWVYSTFVMLWWHIIYKTENFDESDYFFSNTFTYRVAKDNKQITPMEFIEKMRECFDDKFIYIPILQYSAMMLMNVWQDKVEVPIYPALLFTGTTGKWKTTIVELLKSYWWYYSKDREFSLWGSATTAQLVKQAAVDNSILFLEEVTGIINPKVEQSIRAIINRDRWWVGLSWWKNAYYNFKSPILALWQRTFIEDSINNRFAIIDMDHQKKRWTQDQLEEMKTYSCTNYIYEKLYGNWEVIKSLHKKYSELLINSDLQHRSRDVIVFSFIMNEFLGIDIPFDTLIEQVKRHLKNVWLEKPKVEISPEAIFKTVLIEWFMKRQITWTYSDLDNNSKSRYEIFITSEFMEQNRAKIYSSIAYFNEKAQEFKVPEPMFMAWNILTINIMEIQQSLVDRVLSWIMLWVWKTSKWILSYVPSM